MRKANPSRYVGKVKAKKLELATLGTPPPLEPSSRETRVGRSAKKVSLTTERPVRGERVERPVGPVRKTPKRETKRHAFEIYKDQLESLHELRLAHMKSGELKSLSGMVREAFDSYIKNRTGSTTRTEIR